MWNRARRRANRVCLDMTRADTASLFPSTHATWIVETLAAILNTWGTDGGKFPRADVDGSGTVDGADLAAVLSQWGPCE